MQPIKALCNLRRNLWHNLSDGGLPVGAKIVEHCLPEPTTRKLALYRAAIFLLTYVSYCCYYIARKPMSVGKTELINCTSIVSSNDTHCSSFISEIDGTEEGEAKMLLGILDTSFLLSYALFMFVSGVACDHLDLRYFLSSGMILSGLVTILFGSAYYWGIHSIGWFIIMQIFSGVFQSTGWPGVLSAVTNWFGKGKKGLFLGIWCSHTYVGSILGSLIAGAIVEKSWGLSFIVPGSIAAVWGLLLFLVLVPRPEQVGLQLDQQIVKSVNESNGDVKNTLEANSKENGDMKKEANMKAISFLSALKIPGVIEFSLCFFFAKLVNFTFIYWLPTFIMESGINVSPEDAAYLTTLFDVGGLIGGILAGIFSDVTGRSASTCAVMLLLSIPMLFGYQYYSNHCPLNWSHHDSCYSGNIGLLFLLGLLVQGPITLISTVVSAELGTNPVLTGSTKALATVSAIINGTGSIGAAIGPFLAGAIPKVELVFIMTMVANGIAILLLTRLVVKDVQEIWKHFRGRSFQYP